MLIVIIIYATKLKSSFIDVFLIEISWYDAPKSYEMDSLADLSRSLTAPRLRTARELYKLFEDV